MKKNDTVFVNRPLMGARLLVLVLCFFSLCLYWPYDRMPSRLRDHADWRTCALCPDGSVVAGLPATGSPCGGLRRSSSSNSSGSSMPLRDGSASGPSLAPAAPWAAAQPALGGREQRWVVTATECEAMLDTFIPFRHEAVAAANHTLVPGFDALHPDAAAQARDPLLLLTKEVRGAGVQGEENFLYRSEMPRRSVWYGSPRRACLPPPTVPRGANPARDCPRLYITHNNLHCGRHHNQLQSFVNTLSLARRLNRTVVLPPFCTDSSACELGVNPSWLYDLDRIAAAGYCFITYKEFERRLLETYGTEKSSGGSSRSGTPKAPPAPTVQYFFKASEDHVEVVPFLGDEVDVAQLLRPGLGRMERHSVQRAFFFRNLRPFLPHTVLNEMASAVGQGLLFEAEQRAAAARRARTTTRMPTYGPGLNMTRAPRRSTAVADEPFGRNNRDELPQTPPREETAAPAQPQQEEAEERYCVRTVPPHGATGALPTPTLIALSQALSFSFRASQTETALLLHLLQPSASVQAAFAAYCTANHLPCGGAADTTSAPANMVAVHVRTRERSCMYEINFRFRCPDTHFSSFIDRPMCDRYMQDCSEDPGRVVAAYDRLTEHMRPNSSSAAAWPTLMIVHDQESAELVAQDMRTLVARGVSIFRPTGNVEPLAVNVTAQDEEELVAAFPWNDSASYAKVDRARRRCIALTALVHELVVEYFLMTKLPKAFEGNFLSSVSQNICMRRFHNGLPCNNVFPGFFEYTFGS